MTMPHLMNCEHSESGWCIPCVKRLYEEKWEAICEAGKYETCLQACSQRLQAVLPIGEVKAIGLMEVPIGIEALIRELESRPERLEPRFAHTSLELRYVANLLDALNSDGGAQCGAEGELEVYWADCVMGVVGLDGQGGVESWVYFPSANANFELSGGTDAGF